MEIFSEVWIFVFLSIIMLFVTFIALLSYRKGYHAGRVEEKKISEAKEQIAELQGVDRGRKEALSELTVEFDTFVDVHDGWFYHQTEIGHTLRLFIRGVPVGHPMKYTKAVLKKAKPEQVQELIAQVRKEIDEIASTLTPAGVAIKLLKRGKSFF